MGLLTDRVNNKMEESNLINEHALNREPVPLISEKGADVTGAPNVNFRKISVRKTI